VLASKKNFSVQFINEEKNREEFKKKINYVVGKDAYTIISCSADERDFDGE